MSHRSRRRSFAGTLSLCLLAAGTVSAQSFFLPPAPAPVPVAAAEYFFDADPGAGNAFPISLTPGTDVSANFTASTSALTSGIHRIYYRAKDAGGSWGLTSFQMLYVAPAALPITAVPAEDVTAIEYFIDANSGFGQGISLPVASGADVTASGNINATGLGTGIHNIYARAKNAQNVWGLTSRAQVIVIPAITIPANGGTLPDITRAEYFVDTDPGFGQGTSIPVTRGTDITVEGFMANIGALAPGVHSIFVRAADANGIWSLSTLNKVSVVVANVSIPAPATARPFTMLEYFFDTDPGIGNGTLLTVPATTDLQNYSFAADISTLGNGAHQLFVRTVDSRSLTAYQAFAIAAPLPVKLLSFGARRDGSLVRLGWKTASEQGHDHFVVERSADGKLFSPIGRTAGRGDSQLEQSYTFDDMHPLKGINFYRLKQVDENGTSIYSSVVSIHFDESAAPRFTTNNPVHETLRIFNNGAVDANATFIIRNMRGAAILSFPATSEAVQQVNVAALPPGAYTIQATGNQAARFTKEP